MTRSVLKKFFWNTYDHLGACVLLNVVWFILSIPWILAAYFLLFLLVPWLGALGAVTSIVAGAATLWLNPASLALLAAAWEWADYRRPDRRELWTMLRHHLITGLWLSGIALGVAVVLGVNGAFYLQLPGAMRWVGYLLAGVMLWAQVAFLMIVFHLGLLVARGDLAGPKAIRQATILALRLPVQTLLIGGATLFLGAAFAVTQIGIPLVTASIPAVFAATGERELLKRFRPREPGQDEADEQEEVRTLRDLLRPWDMGR